MNFTVTFNNIILRKWTIKSIFGAVKSYLVNYLGIY